MELAWPMFLRVLGCNLGVLPLGFGGPFKQPCEDVEACEGHIGVALGCPS